MRSIKYTVVTICYNARETIEDTILSVVGQTYENVEYIIIDGGSTDGTVEIIKKYADRLAYWVSEPDKGIYDAMNKGIAIASGEYINFMNSGDKFASNDVVSKIVNITEPNDTLIYGDWNIIFPDGKSQFRKSDTIDYFKTDMPFCHQASFIRTDYIKAHPFDISFNIKSDYDLMYKVYCKQRTSIRRCDIIVCDYDNSGLSSKNYIKGYRENYRIWIDCSFYKRFKSECFIIKWRLKQYILKFIPKDLKLSLQKKKLEKRNRLNID